MNQSLYGTWLGDVFFCFSGEASETKVDAWSAAVRKLQFSYGKRSFQQAALRLAEIRWPSPLLRGVSRKGDRKVLLGRTLEGLALTPEDAWQMLIHWDEGGMTAQGIQPGLEFSYWSGAAKFALELLLRGCIAPSVVAATLPGTRKRSGQSALRAVWGPRLDLPHDEERFRQLAASMPKIGLAPMHLPFTEDDSIEYRQHYILHSFLTGMMDPQIRKGSVELGRELNKVKGIYRRGVSPLMELWWEALLSGERPMDIQGTTTEMEQLTEEIKVFGGAMPAETTEENAAGAGFRLCLRLEPPAELGGGEDWNLSFWAEVPEDTSLLLPASLIWSQTDQEIMIRGRVYQGIQENFLLRLAKAAEISPEIAQAMENAAPEAAMLEQSQVYTFLSRSVPLLRKNGVTVQMPSRWTKEGRRKAGIKIKAAGWEAQDKSSGDKPKLGVDQVISFELEAVLNGTSLTSEELTELASSKAPLVLFRGEWIEIDVKEIRQVLRYMKKNEQGSMTFRELMHLTSETEEDGRYEGIYVEGVETTGLLSALMEGGTLQNLNVQTVPQSLQGTLRPYQERGYQWLWSMKALGFGALLADDMGLGKTVQVITTLLSDEVAGTRLIICPTSLLGNWQRELQRFAPELNMYIHHGTDRLHGEPFLQACREHDVVLTTYHLAGRDAKELKSGEWASIVLDEAQYIKNFGTKQAQSVMKLNAPHRIAMTGTPVENRLSELWSIFQFLNPGYLGTYAFFRREYTGNGEDRPKELGRLRKLVAPFLLRRLKSDPDIRKDLPEKIELKSYCQLTTEQARQYRAVTDDLMARIGESTGIARKGLVLSSLTRLKQICDHPLLLERREISKGEGRSGKMERLFELLDIIRDNGEAALIFTQYVQMGELLVKELAERYEDRPFFLHGGVVKQERDRMVTDFQEGVGSPVFVLSLKAGGVGLNLTRANHVIHFDRWWNPAVENQATDRVFRIGQEKNVEVHKLICQGTLEERIDELIERKRALSEQVVGSGEQWLTEMSSEELQNLIMLQSGNWQMDS
ncbi:SNF2 family DNA or RNA helicase [Paenibacillus shirakamiensis]|uniref:SNF2 family DNA or RNA helicase n=1 Tax=Paenibacillus shirakamiensis TaxID=1265935 RepID=A0ABS4JIW4_9BACL|nr:DEAD/DEAH box helicase [Paenibacillus shirakamiensis]MBP2001635.1 SNF2 family DNA or RNA helicase [Paenibacillus shirakamiensis]